METNIEAIIEKIKPFEQNLLNETYSDTEYKEMLLTTGLSEKEWRDLQAAYDAYINRGQGFLKHQLSDEALLQFKAAQLIKPNELLVHLGLAEVYLQLWKKNGRKTAEEAAAKHAHIALKINSKADVAVQIIVALQRAKPKQQNFINIQKKGKAKNNLSRILFVVIVVIIALIYKLAKG